MKMQKGLIIKQNNIYSGKNTLGKIPIHNKTNFNLAVIKTKFLSHIKTMTNCKQMSKMRINK